MLDSTSQDIKETEEEIKAMKAAKKMADRVKQKEEMLSGAEEFFQSHPKLYYITKGVGYFTEQCNGVWHNENPSSFWLAHGEFIENDFKKFFMVAMEAAGRIKKNVTYSFKNDPNLLNLLDMSQWIKPSTGQHHWMFDVLMQSLGSGKAENIEHLERVITYKYMHPECWMLPCIVIYGEGGVGKNLLIDKVLYRIFAEATVSATSDNLVSTFNSLLKGQVAVMINETVIGKHDNSKLTNLLGKEFLTINEKGVPQYDVANTPLYFVGSNDKTGGALLSRSEADRRLSIMKCERGKTLPYWIAHTGFYLLTETDMVGLIEAGFSDVDFEISITGDDYFVKPISDKFKVYLKLKPEWIFNKKAAGEWLRAKVEDILGDEAEIAKWLNHLITKYGSQIQPVALHGADYQVLLGVQEGVDERLARAVFLSPDFTHIRVKDLYLAYTLACKQTGTRYPFADKTFNIKIEEWLEANAPHIVKNTSKRNFTEGGKRKQAEMTVWLNTDLELTTDERHKGNSSDYYDGEGNNTKLTIDLG